MSDNWLWAIVILCLGAGLITENLSKHEGCIAWCTNIASAGAN